MLKKKVDRERGEENKNFTHYPTAPGPTCDGRTECEGDGIDARQEAPRQDSLLDEQGRREHGQQHDVAAVDQADEHDVGDEAGNTAMGGRPRKCTSVQTGSSLEINVVGMICVYCLYACLLYR